MEMALRDGQIATYSGSVTGLVGVTGDILTFQAPPLVQPVFGQGTQATAKVFRLIRLSMDGTATAAALLALALIKRSTLDTGGTSAPVATTPHDPNNASAASVVTSYTVAPTPGTIIGTAMRSKLLNVLAAGSPGVVTPVVWDFGNRPSMAPKLIGGGTGTIALNVGATLAGALFNIDFEFTEDAFNT